MTSQDILDFWFEEIEERQWFAKDEKFDAVIRERFLDTHTAVAEGVDGWGDAPEDNLARVIVLDQFSRNMFRDTKEAFMHDAQALAIAESVVADGEDTDLSSAQRSFLYMPYMHSESREVHTEAVLLFEALGDEGNLKYEKLHKAIIDQFGRYPHRNEILGRETTSEERVFMESDAVSSF